MLTEDEAFDNSYDVLFVVRVVFLEFFKDAGFDETLFVQTLFVSENFQRDKLLVFMIETFEDLSKAALADAFLHLKPVADMVVHIANVLALVVVKSAVLRTVRSRQWLRLALKQWNVPDLVVFKDLCLLVVEQGLAQMNHRISRIHRERGLVLPLFAVNRPIASYLRELTEVAGRIRRQMLTCVNA